MSKENKSPEETADHIVKTVGYLIRAGLKLLVLFGVGWLALVLWVVWYASASNG